MRIQKVLMIDDDPVIRKIIEISLTKIGNWTVMFAESGRKGIDAIDEFQPDVVLLDNVMPGLDGPATLTLLRAKESSAQIPIIMMTGKVLKQEIQHYYQLGASGVITKPFDPLTLPSDIQTIVDKLFANVACIA